MMLLNNIMLTLMATSWAMLLLNNPMNMTISIISLTILSSMTLSLHLTSWYALILLLIYIGGMMVMFSYFISFCSNDSMMMKMKSHYIIFLVITLYTMKTQTISPYHLSSQVINPYMSINVIVLLVITMILLLMMIIVVKMVKVKNSPLRGFNQHN